MKTILLIIVATLLSACASVSSVQGMRELPPDRRIEFVMDTNWRDAYSSILERARACMSATVLSSSVIVEGDLRTDRNMGSITVFITGGLGTQYSQLIDVNGLQTGTRIVASTARGSLNGYAERIRYWATGGQKCTAE